MFSPEVIATIKSEIELEPRRYCEELAEIVATKHRMKRPSRSKVRKCLLHDLGLTRKKIQYIARQRDAADRLSCLDAYNGFDYDAKQAIFIDESHFSREYDRRWGWGPRGQSLELTQLLSDDVKYSWMCAADMFGVVTASCELLDTSVSEGNVDGERFLRWARTGLFPGLGNFELREARSIVVLDNCVLHHYPPFVAELEATGARLFYLSAYSPIWLRQSQDRRAQLLDPGLLGPRADQRSSCRDRSCAVPALDATRARRQRLAGDAGLVRGGCRRAYGSDDAARRRLVGR